MPRRPNPLRDQIKALEAVVKADRAERRTREAPLRATRRQLSERVRLLRYNIARATKRRQQMTSDPWIRSDTDASFVHGQRWRDTLTNIAKFTADLADAETELAKFHSGHPELTS